MKKVRNLLLVLLAAVLCLLLLTGCSQLETPPEDEDILFPLEEQADTTEATALPSTSTEWDTEFVDGAFADGETISANLGTYKESEAPSAYNILVYNDENYILYDTSVDELDFAIQDGDYIIFLPPAATSKPLIFFLCKNFYNLVTTIDYLLPPPGPRGSHESPHPAPRWIPE